MRDFNKEKNGGRACRFSLWREKFPVKQETPPWWGGCQKTIFLFVGIFLTLLVAVENVFCDSARRPAVVIYRVDQVMSYTLGEQATGQQPVSLSVAIYDGDTIFIGGHTIRLFGIDAPELEQIVEIKGRRVDAELVAKQELVRRINSLYRISCIEFEGYHRVVAHDLHRDEYVARCFGTIADNEDIENEIIVFEKKPSPGTTRDYKEYVIDIGAWLVFKGLAVATSYSTVSVKNRTPYEKIEAVARKKGVGIWKKDMEGTVRPVDWRRTQYEKKQKEIEENRRLDDKYP